MPLRLKSLELQGYKTFASRTLFEFAETVTAIVGPNGSGKSNIADSLRWVLGEQSYSLLRGKKTEDMIFSGSELRPRAGMASATITFDNTVGWLPIDFSEVAVTRRAYRDGTNEYLINGQRVRLKDVSELLAQSGLAERTYTIIGQGLVDAALALKAEERRRLFEEAAGIGLHRSRREEALRRLETTRRNLERVQDILAELQPRLRSLERQARRAQEYEQVRADLRVVLRDWYGYHWHKSQHDLLEAREAARLQEVALDTARQEQAALDEKLSVLRDRLTSLRASLNSWHRQSSQLHSRRETISKDLAVAVERSRALAEQQGSIRSEMSRLSEELGIDEERVSSANQEVERITAELNDARSQVTLARRELAERQAERNRLEKDVQNSRQALSGLNTRQGQLQARLAERRAQAERAVQALHATQSAVQSAEGEVQSAEQRAQVALVQQGEAERAYQAAEAALGEHRRQVALLEAERKAAQDERASVNAELARLKAQSDVLEQAEAALSGYSSGARLLLDAARKAKLKTSKGALGAVLDVPAEIETAVAAALGEFLDAVLLEEDAESALDLLLKEAARGALLPLANLKPHQPVRLPVHSEDAALVGIAADLVHAPPELRPVVDLLLGQVVVVRDRAAVRRCLAELSRSLPFDEFLLVRVVTLRGEVFLANGPVLAGGSPPAGGGTVLSRARQRRELRKDLDLARQKLQEANVRFESTESALKNLQVESDRLNLARQSARQDLDKSLRAVDAARMAVEQAARQARWQKEQAARQAGELSRGEKEAVQMAAELNRLEQDIQQVRGELRERNNALAALPLDDYQAQVAHWNTQSAVAERALLDSKSRQRERQAALQRALESQSALDRRLEEACTALEKLESERAALRLAENEVGGEIEAFRVLMDPAEAELLKLEEEEAALQTVEASSRQTLSLVEHRYAQTKINLDRRQESLQNLRRRIEDDFGLVAFEFAEEVSGQAPLPIEGMVEQLPRIRQIPAELEETIKRQRAQLRRMGPVNPEAQAEYKEVSQRYKFLTEQVSDLEAAEVDVRQVIAELDTLMQREFRKTFEAVASEFKGIFTRLFGGGSARLLLTDPEDLTNTGIDIEARLPGRRAQGLSLLSGGERSLTASALVFALLKVSPTPFCVLDEVDAMLDEANVGRFRDLLRELSANTQFVIVTHNRNTVQAADIIYGVTMGRDSASQVLSLRLDDVSKLVGNADDAGSD